MSPVKRPSFQFYPSDWSADIKLRSTSVAARGLWIEIMCIMHQSDIYGYFPSILVYAPIDIPLPEAPNVVDHMAMVGRMIELNADFCSQLSRMVGSTENEIHKCMCELARAQVFSFSDDGKIYSKRMVKDEVLRNLRAAAGKLGGCPPGKDKKKPTAIAVNPSVTERLAAIVKPSLLAKAGIPDVVADANQSLDLGIAAPFVTATPLAAPRQLGELPADGGVLINVPQDQTLDLGTAAPDFIGNERTAYYRLSDGPHPKRLTLFVPEEGKTKLRVEYPTVDIDALCNRIEFYWNTSNGIKNRPIKSVYTALSLAARKDLKDQAFKQGQSMVSRKTDASIDELAKRFNASTRGLLPGVSMPLSFEREILVKNAMSKYPDYAYWMDVFAAIKTHTMPPNCGFDWLLKEEGNWTRVKERTFEARKSGSQTGQVNSSLAEKAGTGVTISNSFGRKV